MKGPPLSSLSIYHAVHIFQCSFVTHERCGLLGVACIQALQGDGECPPTTKLNVDNFLDSWKGLSIRLCLSCLHLVDKTDMSSSEHLCHCGHSHSHFCSEHNISFHIDTVIYLKLRTSLKKNNDNNNGTLLSLIKLIQGSCVSIQQGQITKLYAKPQLKLTIPNYVSRLALTACVDWCPDNLTSMTRSSSRDTIQDVKGVIFSTSGNNWQRRI